MGMYGGKAVPKGARALHAAVMSKELGVVQALLDAGARLQSQALSPYVRLHFNIYSGVDFPLLFYLRPLAGKKRADVRNNNHNHNNKCCFCDKQAQIPTRGRAKATRFSTWPLSSGTPTT